MGMSDVRLTVKNPLGEKEDSQHLGVFTLEALGLTLDPLKRSLHKAILRL